MTFDFDMTVADLPSAPPLSDEFSVAYKADSTEAPAELTPVKENEAYKLSVTVPAGTKTVEGSIIITGTAEDLAHYMLTLDEVNNAPSQSWTYDPSVYEVTFEPEGLGYKPVIGRGMATFTKAAFGNIFKLYSIEIPVTKNIDGHIDAGEEMEFLFYVSIANENATLSPYVGMTFAPGAANATYEVKDEDGMYIIMDSTDGDTAQAILTVTGTYEDLIGITDINIREETATAPEGWVYDDGEYDFTVSYDDTSDTFRAVGVSRASFTNTRLYTLEIPVVKQIAGDATTVDMTFTFRQGIYDLNMEPAFGQEELIDINGDPVELEFSRHSSFVYTGAAKGEKDSDVFSITVPAGETSAAGAIVFTGTWKDLDLIHRALWFGVAEELSDVPEYWEYDDSIWYYYFYQNGEGWTYEIKQAEKGSTVEDEWQVVSEIRAINTYDVPAADDPPADDVPDTGDSAPIALLSLMLLGCGAALTFLFFRKRKEN